MLPRATGVPGFGFAKVSGGGMICSVEGQEMEWAESVSVAAAG